MILLVRENEKIKSIVEWTDWLDSKIARQRIFRRLTIHTI